MPEAKTKVKTNKKMSVKTRVDTRVKSSFHTKPIESMPLPMCPTANKLKQIMPYHIDKLYNRKRINFFSPIQTHTKTPP